MNQQLSLLRERTKVLFQDKNFIHHKWFIKYHLEIVEKIAFELCEIYKEANKDLVTALVWLHDIGKVYDFEDQYNATPVHSRELLTELNFESTFIDRVIEYLTIFDKKLEMDMHEAPIEVQIGVSADAFSHFVGPFFSLWWYENAQKPFEELMADNMRKAQKDWERKLVLPEARQAAEKRYTVVMEQAGEMPEKFLG
jgi:hypothetical protein